MTHSMYESGEIDRTCDQHSGPSVRFASFQIAASTQSTLYASAAAHLGVVLGSNHHPLAIVVAILIGVVAVVWHGLPSSAEIDREAMLGTWTDEAGPPGNSIRFYLVPREIPGIPDASALEGHATVVKLLGDTSAQAGWNYGSCDPLVLNFWIGQKMLFVVIVRLDADHILMRFGSDPKEIMGPGAISHPDTKRFKRIPE